LTTWKPVHKVENGYVMMSESTIWSLWQYWAYFRRIVITKSSIIFLSTHNIFG
jgi:hypothetical protein